MIGTCWFSMPLASAGTRWLSVVVVAMALLFPVGGARANSETVSNRFDLYVPVTLSVLEVSSAVGLLPAPVLAFAALPAETLSNAVREVLR